MVGAQQIGVACRRIAPVILNAETTAVLAVVIPILMAESVTIGIMMVNRGIIYLTVKVAKIVINYPLAKFRFLWKMALSNGIAHGADVKFISALIYK